MDPSAVQAAVRFAAEELKHAHVHVLEAAELVTTVKRGRVRERRLRDAPGVERLVLEVSTAGEDMAERSRCTVLLIPVEGGTRLELTVDGLSGALAAEHVREGWTACLEGIDEHLGT